jgi:predicted nucleic acid-binding Zn ribbon protein
MRRSNVQNIGDVVNELLKNLNIDHKLKEVRLTNSWGEVLGNNVARSTTKIFIKNRVLFVYLKSSVIRSELLMLKSGIIKALNDKVGEKIIDDIVLK